MDGFYPGIHFKRSRFDRVRYLVKWYQIIKINFIDDFSGKHLILCEILFRNCILQSVRKSESHRSRKSVCVQNGIHWSSLKIYKLKLVFTEKTCSWNNYLTVRIIHWSFKTDKRAINFLNFCSGWWKDPRESRLPEWTKASRFVWILEKMRETVNIVIQNSNK